MLKMVEKQNNDKGQLIDRTAWFTRLSGKHKFVSTFTHLRELGQWGIQILNTV